MDLTKLQHGSVCLSRELKIKAEKMRGFQMWPPFWKKSRKFVGIRKIKRNWDSSTTVREENFQMALWENSVASRFVVRHHECADLSRKSSPGKHAPLDHPASTGVAAIRSTTSAVHQHWPWPKLHPDYVLDREQRQIRERACCLLVGCELAWAQSPARSFSSLVERSKWLVLLCQRWWWQVPCTGELRQQPAASASTEYSPWCLENWWERKLGDKYALKWAFFFSNLNFWQWKVVNLYARELALATSQKPKKEFSWKESGERG